MAPTISALPDGPEDTNPLLNNERKIWIIVVPLSVCIPCLIAVVIYIYRRYRQRSNQVPVSEGLPIEAHHQAWLEHMRNNQANADATPLPAGDKKSIYPQDTAHRPRSQSTSALPPMSYTRPARCDSPLQQPWNATDGMSDKDVFEFPPPQELHPAMRRDSTK